jgi:hypothetical protein
MQMLLYFVPKTNTTTGGVLSCLCVLHYVMHGYQQKKFKKRAERERG